MPNKKISWITMIVIIFGLLIVGCSPKATKLSEKTFPEQYQGMTRVQMLGGQEAIEGISKLHGTNIDKISKGYQVMYQGNDKQMLIWVSESPTVSDATKLLVAMNSKISTSKVFTGFKEETIDGRTIYYVFGMDMDNYYYQRGKALYWVAIEAKEPQKELIATLKDF